MVGRRGRVSAVARGLAKTGKVTTARPPKAEERAGTKQLTPAARDAKIRELRESWKRELAEIMETARRRREREKPRKFQEILLWEMDQIRHAEAKYRSAVDRLLGRAPDAELLEKQPRPRLAAFKAGATDKRPSQRAAKPRLAE